MPQSFFTNTIESRFIQNMLFNTPLPLMDTVSVGDFVIEGCFYIFDRYVIKCTRSGEICNDRPPLYCSEDVYVSDKLVVGTGKRYANFIRVAPYIFGEHYDKITERFIPKHCYYDSDTHYFLGKYLRCVRDIYGIDLMPFYNCYVPSSPKDMHLSMSEGVVVGTNNAYKLVGVPIKFNKTYSICIDCSASILMSPVFLGDAGLIKDASGNDMSSDIGVGVMQINQSSFTKPILYRVDTEDKQLMDIERYLTLLIQLPSNNTSSVLVAESDISGVRCERIFNAGELNRITAAEQNKLMLSELSLARFNDNTSYAFSDRLIEYLLLNVITGEDEFTEDIVKVQSWTGLKSDNSKVLGIWRDSTRYDLYHSYMTSPSTTKIDINGYVDSDMENYIIRNGGM